MSYTTKTEIDQMLALGELTRQHGGLLLAGREVQRGGNLETLMRRIADKVREEPLHAAANRMLGLPDREIKGYSVNAIVEAQLSQNWAGAGLERSLDEAIADATGKVANGAWIPLSAMMRNFDVGTPTEAGNTVGTEKGPIGDPLRAASILASLGATTIVGQKMTLSVPRFANSDAPSGWLGETAAADQLAPVTATLELPPKRLAAQVSVSLQFLKQNPRAEEAVMRYLTGALFAQLEDGAINGTGLADDPTGIRNTVGVNEVVGGTDGATLAWSHLVDMEKACALDNAPESTAFSGFAINPATRAWLRQKPRGSNLPFCWDDAGERNLLGRRVGVTSNLPSDLDKGSSTGTCSSLIYSSDWRNLWMVWFGPAAVDLLVDRFTLAVDGRIRLIASMFANAGVAQPSAFACFNDALLS